tara:strand:+ start:567 stop:881 length:315 start_codon:yes stop_codon:yes gene_type:complete
VLEVELEVLVKLHHVALPLVEEVELVELVFQTILQAAVLITLVVVVVEEDLQMVLHAGRVDLEEIQVDQTQETLVLLEQITLVVAVEVALHLHLELVVQVDQEL